MKGFELTEAIRREVVKKGTAGSPVRCLSEDGDIYDILDVEAEVLPGGKHVTWLKLQLAEAVEDQ